MDVVVLFGVFLILLMLSVPIGYAIGIATLITIINFTSMPPLMIAQNAIAGVDSFIGDPIFYACWELNEQWRNS